MSQNENDQGHQIRDPDSPRYFAMVPYIVIDSDLSHAALRLYLHYKMVCGESPTAECFQTLNTQAARCRMRRQTVIDSRNELEEKKLIDVERRRHKDGSTRIIVTLKNVWKENNQRYGKTDKRVTQLPEGNPGGQLPNRYLPQLPPGNSNNNPYNKNPEELIPTESTRGKPANGPGDEPPRDADMQPRPARPDGPSRTNGTKGRGRPPLRNGPLSSNEKPVSPKAADPPEPLDGNDGFARKAARYLHKTLADSRSNLVFPGGKRRPVTVERLEKDSILPLLTNGVATRGQIRELLTWHRTWHSETYTPRIGASGDLYARWDKLRDAMERWRGRTSNGKADCRVPEGPSDEERRDTLNMRVRAEMAERCTEEDMAAYVEAWNVLNRRYGCRDRAPLVETQGQVDDVLEGLGLDRGRFPLEWFLHRR